MTFVRSGSAARYAVVVEMNSSTDSMSSTFIRRFCHHPRDAPRSVELFVTEVGAVIDHSWILHRVDDGREVRHGRWFLGKPEPKRFALSSRDRVMSLPTSVHPAIDAAM